MISISGQNLLIRQSTTPRPSYAPSARNCGHIGIKAGKQIRESRFVAQMFSSYLRRNNLASVWIKSDVELAPCFARLLAAMFLATPVVTVMYFQASTVHAESDRLF